MDDLMTTADVARELAISPRRVLALARTRGVGRRVGRDWLFTVSDLDALRMRVAGRPRRDEMADRYVHKLGDRYIVAEYRDGRYYAPQRPEVKRVTGCHTTYGSLDYVAGDAFSYSRRSAAVKKARELFGDD